MRLLFTWLSLTAGLPGLGLCAQAEESRPLPLKDLLAPHEYREYQSKPEYRKRMDLFKKVLERREYALRRYMKARDLENTMETLEALKLISHYAQEEASRTANRKDQRSKEVKKLEIVARNVRQTIESLKTTVRLLYQPGFEAAARTVEALRNHLLVQIFGRALAERRAEKEKVETEMAGSAFHGFFGAGPAAFPSAPAPTSPDDRFTEKEYTRIQDNQELVKRVEAFLDIAEARLQEIAHRLEKREWEGKEENPLQFYTFWDLIHAYERAIESIMINIDEKARYKLAKEKDIHKALEKLNQKINEFIPQLPALKQKAIELQDEELYNETFKAEKTSETAKKGSELGLGAPVK